MKLLKHILLTLSLALLAPATWAQTIPNPSFEANTFTVYPGYVSDNGAITSWTASPANRVGLNPSSGSPFADTGEIPQGANVAFVQSVGSGSTLSTTITGLTSSVPYRVSFRANSRSIVVVPNPSWSLNGGAFVPFTASPAVGGSNPYYTNSGAFIATGTTASLVISNQTADDSTVLVDDFSIASVPVGTWSVNAWTGDASSGIVAGQTLWAYHFGTTNIATVNGVTVPGVGTNGNPFVSGQFAISGIPFVLPNDGNNLTGLGGSGSAVMAKSFIYGGAPGLITVQGLTVGQSYTLSIYGVGFDVAPATRTSIFTSYADTLSVNENSLGENNGVRVDYTFTAVATNNLITVTPTNANTFHTYALALRQTLLVTTTSNAGPGSLRQAVLDAATVTGTNTITFAPALSGATITLTNEIVLGSDVTIDATSLPGGVTVSGGNVTRIFYVPSGRTVSLLSLTLTGGNGVGAIFSGDGGAIENNEGTLTLLQCTVSGNSGNLGGAIENYRGVLTLTNCTLSGNSAKFGGAISSDTLVEDGTETIVVNSTISGNAASAAGGGINSFVGPTEIIRATISGNSAPAGQGGGVASYGDAYTLTTVTESIIAGNSGSDADFVSAGFNSVTSSSHNLIGNGNALAAFNQPGDLTNAVPLLAPLGNYGGPTQTMPPLPGSPAIDAASVIAGLSTDQRGSARNVGAAPDIGAVESSGLWVQNNNDSGANSLRDVLASATSITNSKIILFTTNLSGATITLSGQIMVTDTNGVTIHAAALPAGIQVSGNSATRVFYVTNGAVATLNSLTVANGRESSGTLATNRGGGGVFSRGRVALLNCCVVSNEVFTSPISPSFGAGIACDVSGDVRLTNCTVAFNQLFGSQSPGAAFYNLGTFVMDHCTIVNNLSASGTNGGVAAGGTTSLHATVLANGQNDFINVVGGSSLGNNLISDGSGSGQTNGINGDQIGTSGSPLNPLLASFGNYGGPTQTLPPLPGSPAINAGGAAGFATDQRGYPCPVGLAADIGAVEGIYNAAGSGKITNLTRLPDGSIRFSLPNLTNASFPVFATTNVNQSSSNWTQIGFATETSAGTGLIQFTDIQAANYPRRFYRVKSP